jgi:hypothetical protein
MKFGGTSATAEEYFPRGKPKSVDPGGGIKDANTPKEKREARMVNLFANKATKNVVDKKKKKTKKGRETGEGL